MKLNIGTKDELEILGFKPDTNKKIATVILCVLTGGLLLLLLSWKPAIRIKFTHVPCPTGEATVLLLTDIYGQVWEEKVVEQTSVSKDGMKIKQNYFYNKKIKYIWDNEGAIFSRLSYPPLGRRVSDMRNVQGLSSETAKERKELYGENGIKIEIQSIWKLFVSQAYNPFYIFQAYTIIIWCVQTYYIYSGCIFFLSAISIILNIWETRRQAKVLREKMVTQSEVRVIRDGEVHILDSKELVPGDVVNVVAGPKLLEADMALLEGSTILNEAILTGESVPITKVHLPSNDDSPFNLEKHKRHILHCGTHVLQVRGGTELSALVTQTGYDTVKGEMVRSILFPKPMDFHIYSDFLRLIFIFVILGLIAMTWSLVNWSMNDDVGVATIIFNSIDLLTFVVPPIIPATITAINLWAQKRLQKKKIFCLSSNYISLAGPVDIVCFDKTGTLTEDDLSLEGVIPCKNGQFLPHVKDLLKLPIISKFTQTMATCHSVARDPAGNFIGHPLDIKIFTAIDWKIDDPKMVSENAMKPMFVVSRETGVTSCEYEVLKTYPFESGEQRMTVIGKENSSKSYEIFIKGAPEKIASLCSKDSVPDSFSLVLEWYTRQGLRIVAAAYKQLPTYLNWEQLSITERENLEQGSTFLGLIILQNKLKPETSPALQIIHQALITTVMVTGDNLLTATSVARQCGLVKSNQQVIFVKAEYAPSSAMGAQHLVIHFTDSGNSSELGSNSFQSKLRSVVTPNYVFGTDGNSFKLISQYDQETFKRIVHKGKIFARMKPDQKIEVIEALQQLGHQVAMCGDGCNDCGALKAAHAGISLSSTEASVAAPFTSLQQDIGCVSTLIREGRATLVSTYVSFKYNIAYSFAALLVVLFIFTIYTEPSDTQYLIMDLVLITVPSLVMGNTAASSILGQQKPSRRVVHPLHITSIISFLGFQTLLYCVTWKYLENQSWFEPFVLITDEYRPPPGYEITVIIMQAFFTFVLGAIVFSHDYPFRKPFYTNRILTAYLVFSTILCIIFMFCQVDWLYYFLDFKPLPYSGFTWTVFFSILLMGAICFIWERWFLYGFVEGYFIPWVLRLWGPRLPFEHLEQSLKLNSKWPTLDDEDSYENNETYEKSTLIQLEDFSDDPLGKPHGFFRKTTKRHRFTAEVKYVDELKPLRISREEEGNPEMNTKNTTFTDDQVSKDSESKGLLPSHIQDLSNETSSQDSFGTPPSTEGKLRTFQQNSEKEISPPETDDELDHASFNQELNQRRPQSPSDGVNERAGADAESGLSLIKEMNKEWAKIRNSLHGSMKECETQMDNELLQSMLLQERK